MAAKYPHHGELSSVKHATLPISKIKSFLCEVVNQILTPWPALVMAIENSFGGPDTQEKALWMKSVVVDYIVTRKSIDVDELEDYILNIMETEFSTLIEDGSCYKMCETILRIYKAVQLNDTEEVEQMLSPFRLLVKPTDSGTKHSSISQREIQKNPDAVLFTGTQLDNPSGMETTSQDTIPPQNIPLLPSARCSSIPEHNCDANEPTEDMDTSGEWQIVTRSKKKKKSSSNLPNT